MKLCDFRYQSKWSQPAYAVYPAAVASAPGTLVRVLQRDVRSCTDVDVVRPGTGH